MSTIAALHFPETALSRQDCAAPLLFFSAISSFLVTEEDNHPTDPFCPTIIPAPLGDDLPRFQQLMAELKGNEADFYQGQLANIALDYMEQRDDDTVMAIVNSLAGSPKSPPDKNHERLWQARLLLKLAQMHKEEQAILDQELAKLRGKEQELFEALKGEPEHEEMLAFLAKHDTTPAVRIEVLIKAWAKLFLTADLADTWCLCCPDDTAAAPLLETSEASTGQLPSRLLRLPLPEIANMDDYEEKRQQWRAALAPCLNELARLLPEIAQNGLQATSLTDLTRQAAQWTTQYSQHDIWPEAAQPLNPQQCPPVPHLELFLLGSPAPSLLARLTNEPEPAPSKFSHTILATISRRSATCQ